MRKNLSRFRVALQNIKAESEECIHCCLILEENIRKKVVLAIYRYLTLLDHFQGRYLYGHN